jgi:two-component system cell cycle response regulator DivK
MPGLSVLVVEDSPLNARLIEGLLTTAGLSVTLAGDAGGALAALDGLTPDLILMDMQLPGMSGLELTRLLKGDPSIRRIPIVALTANNSSINRQEMLDAGCDQFISKPIDPAQFAARICALISGSEPGSEALPLVGRVGSVLNNFERLRRAFLSEGARDSELLLGVVEQGATDRDFIDEILHRWVGCGSAAELPEISERAEIMRDLIARDGADLAAVTGEARALRQLFEDALASCA